MFVRGPLFFAPFSSTFGKASRKTYAPFIVDWHFATVQYINQQRSMMD